jgi:phosphonate degradation associated HDIG domain protein
MSVVDLIIKLFEERGADAYLGEEVTQLEHALQSGWAAERDGQPDDMIVAALLHDIGHLLAARSGEEIDDRHEELGFRFLQKHFPDSIAQIARLHVPAKRFLTATDPGYVAALSPTSQRSLALQGGAFSSAEAVAFTALPHAAQAVTARRYDDMAKTPGSKTPDLEHFRPIIARALR